MTGRLSSVLPHAGPFVGPDQTLATLQASRLPFLALIIISIMHSWWYLWAGRLGLESEFRVVPFHQNPLFHLSSVLFSC